MEYERTFEEQAAIYDEVRPGYPEEIYTLVDAYGIISTESRILEIGSGSGIATREILSFWNVKMTCIEPGEALCRLAEEKLGAYDRVRIINTTFEEYADTRESFDAIFSASAFHWIGTPEKYRTCSDLLRNGGLLVPYWNSFGIADRSVKRRIGAVYEKFGFPPKATAEETAARRTREIADSGFFTFLEDTRIRSLREYDANGYTGLLRTFSDHTVSKVPGIEKFFEEIGGIISDNGDSITIYVETDIKIVRKCR